MRCLSRTKATESALFCDPCVRQIFKLKREGETVPSNRSLPPYGGESKT